MNDALYNKIAQLIAKAINNTYCIMYEKDIVKHLAYLGYSENKTIEVLTLEMGSYWIECESGVLKLTGDAKTLLQKRS